MHKTLNAFLEMCYLRYRAYGLSEYGPTNSFQGSDLIVLSFGTTNIDLHYEVVLVVDFY